MTVKTFLAVAAGLYAAFGLVFLIAPDTLTGMHGATLNPVGILLGRVLGASLLAMALVFWGAQDLGHDAQASALNGGIVYNAVCIVAGYNAITAGVVNSMGWGLVALHIVLLAGFAYFAFAGRRQAA